MEKHQYGFVFIFSIILSLGLVSFLSCIAAELKRTKLVDLKLNGKLCSLPGSHAFGFGIAALLCLLVAQIMGNLIICRYACSRDKRGSCKARAPGIAKILLFISWMSFGIAVILMSGAISMSRRQPYGKGWLDGECYIVKEGTYIGSAILVLVTIGSTLGSAFTANTRYQADKGQKIHAQVVG
ncbi:protein MODIFYING WALL LIGNIN-2-like [Juglans microcarpa x Juglans regia]|uniref:protein MODIFYING WALL LIGNIN-2-like n=1 Tax=Juglans microcarpa x Juglans regia TaxID=2249226 RepID=UPI001B7F2B25|nr:protein MODIFYING WALL LIGNIN-2-like [Juglans microcarpa x Juglans regia]